MGIRDSKGHFVKPGFTVCGSCLRDDWKNYWVDRVTYMDKDWNLLVRGLQFRNADLRLPL